MSSHNSFQAAAELGDNDPDPTPTQAEVTEILDGLLDWLEPDDDGDAPVPDDDWFNVHADDDQHV